jgi:hypothetical protein
MLDDVIHHPLLVLKYDPAVYFALWFHFWFPEAFPIMICEGGTELGHVCKARQVCTIVHELPLDVV